MALRSFAEENPNASLIVRFAVLETSHAKLIENAAAQLGHDELLNELNELQ